ncbi:MAG: hypothetical protein QOG28_631, partial [Trebonia sp.]|nr:hypothetical protein [Trebonia sp.]
MSQASETIEPEPIDNGQPPGAGEPGDAGD